MDDGDAHRVRQRAIVHAENLVCVGANNPQFLKLVGLVLPLYIRYAVARARHADRVHTRASSAAIAALGAMLNWFERDATAEFVHIPVVLPASPLLDLAHWRVLLAPDAIPPELESELHEYARATRTEYNFNAV